jgi:hypothetical protein
MRSSEPHLPPPLCLRETHRVVAASPRITPPVRSITTYSFFLIIRIRLFVRLITRVHMPRFLFNIQVAVTKKERRRTLAGLHPELPILSFGFNLWQLDPCMLRSQACCITKFPLFLVWTRFFITYALLSTVLN